MKSTTSSIARAIALAMTLVLAAPVAAITYYVAPLGADSGACDSTVNACATIAYAVALATGPGDVISLASGTYPLAAETLVTKSGSAGSLLTIRGAGQSSTILDGSALAQNRAVLKVQANYVAIEDLTATASTDPPLWIEGSGHAIRRVRASTSRSANAACVYLLTADHVGIDQLTTDGCAKQGIQIAQSSNLTLDRVTSTSAQNHGIQINNSTDVVVSGATIAGNGLTCAGCNGIALSTVDRVAIGAYQHQQPTLIDGHPGAGLSATNCGQIDLTNTILVGNSAGVDVTTNSGTLVPMVTLNHTVIAQSTSATAPVVNFTSTSGMLTVKNSILAFNPATDIPATAIGHSDNVRFQNGMGGAALGGGEQAVDPLFANVASKDFHLKSTAGRFFNSSWVFDAVTSPAIDAADPTAPYAYETSPNGARANAGAYGNTVEASHSAPRPDAGMPDTRLPDANRPDAAPVDARRNDLSAADTAARADATRPDLAGHDLTDQDLVIPDTALADAGSLIARAGPDLVVDVPADVVLDGTHSQAPAGASFNWTRKVAPAGLGDEPSGATPQATVRIDQPGLWVFELVVEVGGQRSSDLVQVDARGEATHDSCGCRSNDRAPIALGALLLLGPLRRRALRAAK